MSQSFMRRVGRRMWVATIVAFVLTGVGMAGANVYLERQLQAIARVDVDLDKAGSSDPVNFLLIGSDTRAFVEDGADAESFGDQQEVSGQRSDTIIIMHLDPKQKKTLMVSFPRDLWVDIPGQGGAKINAAYNEGPQKVIDTIRSNFDIPIHNYLEVDFGSFRGIVDAIGSIPVYFPAPARDTFTGLNITNAGCNLLNGESALSYVRSRYYEELVNNRWQSDPTGDIGRIKRQQDFMRRLASKSVSEGLNSPQTALDVSKKLLPKLKADRKFGKNDILRLLNSFGDVDPNDPNQLEMTTVPNRPAKSGEVKSGGQAVLVPREPDAGQLFDRLRSFNDTAAGKINPSSVRLRVLNGSGVDGAASTALDKLQDEGFNPAGTGNNPNLLVTEVRYLPSAKGKAELVKSYLGGVGKLVQSPDLIDADVVLVIGADFRGITVPDGDAPPPTEATTTTAFVSTTKAKPKDNTTQETTPEQACR